VARALIACAPALGAAATAGGYILVVRGAMTLDLGVGRRVRSLGPLTIRVAAPRETLFDVIAGPYLGRTPRAMAEKLRVLERATDMVLAEHVTTVSGGLRAVTLETVRFERPERISFRLIRGPVPHVLETFELHDVDGGAELQYRGELGTDLWGLGALWGDRVARSWEAAVRASLHSAGAEAERRSASR
jgi:polyketide cyclase/dehydrase/lipid transport protein